MRPLSNGYQLEVDAVDDAAWLDVVGRFADGSVYQVWQTGVMAGPFRGTSRVVLKNENAVAAAAEVRLFLVPVLGGGIAYVRWGPLFRRIDGRTDADVLAQSLRALRNEFVSGRGMVLRMNPRFFAEHDQSYVDVFRSEGFEPLEERIAERTVVVDLTVGLDALRRGLDKKWRNCLSKAERSGLSVQTGRSIELFNEFASLYTEMLRRKGFTPMADLEAHRRLQEQLPEHMRMLVVIARDAGEPCAGAIITDLGHTALYLFGATSERGMRTCGSYLVQWEVMKLLTDSGVRAYDLHGINPEANPGTYHFKMGLAGKNGREATFIGPVQTFEQSLRSSSVLIAELLNRWRAARRQASRGIADG